MRQDCTLVLSDFERYLRKKKHKLGNGSMGYARGQKDSITHMLKKVKKLKKEYK